MTGTDLVIHMERNGVLDLVLADTDGAFLSGWRGGAEAERARWQARQAHFDATRQRREFVLQILLLVAIIVVTLATVINLKGLA